jgi:hypothetical protein
MNGEQTIKPDDKLVSFIALMTSGRTGLLWPQNIIRNALNQAGVKLMHTIGVYYGQSLQRMLEDALDKGLKYALCLDTDSLFNATHVKQLLTNIDADPNIDALAALQCRRGMPHPLFSMPPDPETGIRPSNIQFEGKPLQVETAHFGLTAIRLEKLKDVPKPWLFGQPDESGSWGEGRVDDDVWFWNQWRKAGRSVFVDSSVSIGHLEEFITCFDAEGSHCVVYPKDWAQEHV